MFVWQKRRNRFKEKLVAGERPIVAWINVPWPPIVEIFGAAGLDAALIDMEHTTNDFRDIEHLILAADCAGVTPIVRPPALDTHTVNRLLDAGAQGIMFADIRTAADAELAVSCTKYPPSGRRGWGGSHTRYAMWEGGPAANAMRASTVEERGVYCPEYVEKSNADALTLLIVESQEGVDNIEEIAAVKGVDAISFGWADFSVQSNFDMETISATADRVYEACRSHGVGTSLSIGQAGKTTYYPGCYYIAGIDTLILSDAIRRIMGNAIKAVRDKAA